MNYFHNTITIKMNNSEINATFIIGFVGGFIGGFSTVLLIFVAANENGWFDERSKYIKYH